ncbi:DUF6270 domain-containing protein [Pseudomonas putida]|uniref:DUF6270 domain-containing protein n=1 Tax=Pseudomonas putida TaxID=303 RepID=UPI0024E08035|nr:DUF6270 domain-containing protein [Pseudomonas putida]HDS0980607.1 hypothetical protein [Pseudomonas putida]
MIKNLTIYGSCVSRDIFNLEESQSFKLTDYFARSSMASLCSSSYENEEALGRIPSAFRRRMVAYDFSKQILTQPEAFENADIILIDLIDERFDLVALPSGHIITSSNELAESGLLTDSSVKGFQLIKPGSPERRDLWIQGMHKFLAVLEQHNKLGRLVVNKVYWASRFENASDTNFPVPLAAIEKANQELDWMYNELEKKLHKHQFLHFPPQLLTSDEHHHWGVSPFHYCAQYYKEALAQLNSIISESSAEGLLREDPAPKKSPLISEGATITVAACKSERGIFAQCSLVMDGSIHEGGEFAFYLHVDGDRHDVRWYEASSNARFPIPDTLGELTVTAFYQDSLGEKISCKCTVSSLVF